MVSLNWKHIRTMTCDFQQCGIFTRINLDEPVQPPFKLRNSKLCSVSSLTVIDYSSLKQRLWSDCAYAQADLGLCWSHIPHCWKSHDQAHSLIKRNNKRVLWPWIANLNPGLFGPVVNEMSFKDISIFWSGGSFIQWSKQFVQFLLRAIWGTFLWNYVG